MPQGIGILYWALSILFCLAFAFAILLWCRSWRREEREQAGQRSTELANLAARMAAAVDQLEHTAASLRTADELLAEGVRELRSAARANPAVSAVGQAIDPDPDPPPPRQPTADATPPQAQQPQAAAEDDDRFTAARKMLLAGHSPTEVARELDIGAAEAKMLARVVQQEQGAGEAG